MLTSGRLRRSRTGRPKSRPSPGSRGTESWSREERALWALTFARTSSRGAIMWVACSSYSWQKGTWETLPTKLLHMHVRAVWCAPYETS